MEEKNIMDIEVVTLNELIESGKTVRLIFVNGYQENVLLLDFGEETILAQGMKGERKLVYIHAVSTIAMG